MATGLFEITGAQPGIAKQGDGSVRIAGVNNLNEMVTALTTQAPVHGIQILRITSPGIIAILIGLLLPAVQKVREAASRPSVSHFLPGADKVRQAMAPPVLGTLLPAVNKMVAPLRGGLLPAVAKMGEATHLPQNLISNSVHGLQEGEILPHIENALSALRPYFALDAQVQLQAPKINLDEINGDRLIDLAKVVGVPILIGMAGTGGSGWRGPVTKATPNGIIQRV